MDKQKRPATSTRYSTDCYLSLAGQFGLKLCDYCGQPREIHSGFDHGNSKGRKGRCLIDTTGMMMNLDGRTKKEKADLVRRLNAYFEACEKADEAELVSGAGI